MRPQFEHVRTPQEASWALLWRELPAIPFEWHYHPEFELTLTLNGRGQRFVGDDVADFDDGDLVLVGPRLPHTWFARDRLDADKPMLAIVVWFSQDWVERLANDFAELGGVARLMRRAGRGLVFSEDCARYVRSHATLLRDLAPAQRLPRVLDMLVALSTDADVRPLASAHFGAGPAPDAHNERLARVLDSLHGSFAQPVDIALLAQRAALSVGAFHRFFRRHLQMTVTEYVAQLRVGRASQQLIDTDKPIGVIAAEVGYANLAHFNRQFRAIRKATPRAFRADRRG